MTTRSTFSRLLSNHAGDPGRPIWVFVPYDQLTDRIGPLARHGPEEIGIVLVESRWKACRRPYHKQKLALVLANMRHFALEQARRGVAVRYLMADGPYREALRPVAEELGPLMVMEPAERELRVDLAPLFTAGLLLLRPHEGWLTSSEQFAASQDGPPWRMDPFYRHVRKETGVLMEGGRPAGGRFSLDAENRRPWPGEPPAPSAPDFPVDDIKAEVAELVEAVFADHPGELDLDHLPATRVDADHLWSWAKEECLVHFGPFEDAMSRRSGGLFHTRVSALLNLHRLLPAQVVGDALALDLPLASQEGFVRQVMGWREFVRHVHAATDGFRCGPEGFALESGGVSAERSFAAGEDRPGAPNFLGAATPLPPAYWGTPSGLACLDQVVGQVWREGWSHHITRLMVLSNIALLIDVDPRELTDWFWIAYADAFDWVVEPNVLGMGAFAAGELMTTKPYVSGSNYIAKMSDFCDSCAFDPDVSCPLRDLYWAFLARHEEKLAGIPRMRLPYASLAKRGAERRRRDQRTFEAVRQRLGDGQILSPPPP